MADATKSTCTHLDNLKDAKPLSDTCLECKKDGTNPVQLRKCLTCGYVGCCDSSVGGHSRKHFKAAGHPLIESFKSAPAGGEEWQFCYIDNDYL